MHVLAMAPVVKLLFRDHDENQALDLLLDQFEIDFEAVSILVHHLITIVEDEQHLVVSEVPLVGGLLCFLWIH